MMIEPLRPEHGYIGPEHHRTTTAQPGAQQEGALRALQGARSSGRGSCCRDPGVVGGGADALPSELRYQHVTAANARSGSPSGRRWLRPRHALGGESSACRWSPSSCCARIALSRIGGASARLSCGPITAGCSPPDRRPVESAHGLDGLEEAPRPRWRQRRSTPRRQAHGGNRAPAARRPGASRYGDHGLVEHSHGGAVPAPHDGDPA